MLSKSTVKLIRLLGQRKHRYHHQLFIVEGDKIVQEVLASSLETECLLAKDEWLDALPGGYTSGISEICRISDSELSQISSLKTPNNALAIVRMPVYGLDIPELSDTLSLYLDQVQDPGNLGTIIRIADWFGIGHVLCGEGCADPYNSKTIQSTMGAVTRVRTHQVTPDILGQVTSRYPGLPVYGTFLDGKNIYGEELSGKGIIVMGNESRGISRETAGFVGKRLLIPPYPAGSSTSESLNVAIATSVVCAEFRRQVSGYQRNI